MSVRVADRSLSKMEYIHNAQKIVYLVTERINKYVNKIAKDKRYKHFVKSSQYTVWNSPIYYANQVYTYVQIANMKRIPAERLKYLDMADENLQLLESSIEIFYKSFKPIIKDKFIELLTERIDYEYKLIKGCRRISC